MRKIALLFPGQGSQKSGMGKNWFDQFAVAKQTFEEADEAIGFKLSELCFSGPAAELKMTEIAQPAILATSMAAYRVFQQEYGLAPTYLAGHSLGEFTALAASGSIRFADAIQLVNKRGIFMQQAVEQGAGTMAAVGGIEPSIIATWCTELSDETNSVVISNFNAPDQIVVSGHKSAVDALGKLAEREGARFTPLNVSAPFHSPIMRPAAALLALELDKYQYEEPKIPVISNVTARPYDNKDQIIPLLTEQMTGAVQWIDTMNYLKLQGITDVIELGPQAVLKKLAVKNAPQLKAYSLDLDEDAKQLQSDLVALAPAAPRAFVPRCLGIAVCLKNDNFNEAEYRSGVVAPYKELQDLAQQIEQSGEAPKQSQLVTAAGLLKQIMMTKRTPTAEQNRRWKQLMNDTGAQEWLVPWLSAQSDELEMEHSI
ncbi:ACP S-malonyltransferase [Paenibacillus pini]|uniref:[acyl-carrier-protein] S-malonyltransferase n=1 Tax=Paenibacillus pini JCM 16418 TaxID=1236976 RepID=W7YNW1_9BACL|nr:ACP S-malonyltransferase [Paenibacillus pini]GAF06371.1 malonyl CoA-acyl carrier protein transacylase [Paenibacillus pini JCM 16418]